MLKDMLLEIDDSTINEGTIKVHSKDCSPDVSIRVTKGGHRIYYPVLKQWNVIPLQFGEGCYQITLINNIADLGSILIDLSPDNQNKYLLSNSNYIDLNAAAAFSATLKNKVLGHTPYEQFTIICDYIKKNYIRTFLKPHINYPPAIFNCLHNQRGNCYDLSALAVAVLRNYAIPSRLVIGFNGRIWVEALINNTTVSAQPYFHIFKNKNFFEERWY